MSLRRRKLFALLVDVTKGLEFFEFFFNNNWVDIRQQIVRNKYCKQCSAGQKSYWSGNTPLVSHCTLNVCVFCDKHFNSIGFNTFLLVLFAVRPNSIWLYSDSQSIILYFLRKKICLNEQTYAFYNVRKMMIFFFLQKIYYEISNLIIHSSICITEWDGIFGMLDE